FINVVSYAFTDDAPHRIELRLWKTDAQVLVQIEDDGQPFDPCAQASPDTGAGLEQRKIGGLGIHFIRKTMDVMHYCRKGTRNLLTIVKDLPTPQQP
ncbi:MAG: ATP-binding protein, partial [Opitutales bacterium]